VGIERTSNDPDPDTDADPDRQDQLGEAQNGK
jgi:hypothetical protein